MKKSLVQLTYATAKIQKPTFENPVHQYCKGATEFNNLSSPFAFTSCWAGQSILAGGRYIAHCANNSAY